jgi:hypothetical protein
MIKKVVSKPLLFIIASVLGTVWWFLLIQSHYREVVVNVPLCFYNVLEEYALNTTSEVRVTLAGLRRDLFLIDTHDMALHVNAENIGEPGEHVVALNGNTQMFLRNGVKMIHCTPEYITVVVNSLISKDNNELNEFNELNERNESLNSSSQSAGSSNIVEA